MGTLRAELKLLNYSVMTVEKRAAYRVGLEKVTLDTYKDTEFQNSLYQCFREDVIHHQLLLKLVPVTVD